MSNCSQTRTSMCIKKALVLESGTESIIDTPWTEETATFTPGVLGTTSAVSTVRYKVVGKTMHAIWRVGASDAGSQPAGTNVFDIPGGYVMKDTSGPIGTARVFNGATQAEGIVGVVVPTSTTTVKAQFNSFLEVTEGVTFIPGLLDAGSSGIGSMDQAGGCQYWMSATFQIE